MPRSSSTPPACGPTKCARSTRARTPTRSARPRASTSRCRGRRSATTSPWSSRCRRTSAASSWCRGATPDGTFEHTYVGTTDTDYDGPLDDPQCTPDDIDYLLDAINAPITDGRHRGRHHRHVGRAAPARERRAVSGRTADLSRRHRVNRSAERRDHRDRRQAHDLPRDGRGHRRRGRATCSACGRKSTTKRLPLVGADGYRAARRSRGGPPRRAATARDAARGRGAGRRRPALGEPLVRRAAVHEGRGGARRTRRDGDDARRRARRAAPAPGCSTARAAVGRRRRRRPPDRRRAWVGTTPRSSGRSPHFRTLVREPSRTAGPSRRSEIDLLGVNR